jgi:predicted nucleotidyltransferase
MRICAIICEFNPFHNGHKYLIEQAKAISGCDSVLCIMSGAFTQRGDIAVLDKFNRAKHAILGGADCVIELPAPFAVAPAEIFADGAVKILSSISDVKYLAFGCESATKESLLSCAKAAIINNKEIANNLKENLKAGESYLSSYKKAFEKFGGGDLLNHSNDILALEYTKAIISRNAQIEILPVRRVGAHFRDENLTCDYSSATAIRQNLGNNVLLNNLPQYVFDDLPKDYNIKYVYENLARFALVSFDKSDIKKVYGCTEGLENKLKNLCTLPYDKIIEEATSKRYTSSRIRRIMCANLLKLYRADCEKFLKSDLYIKPLAVNKNRAKEIMSSLAGSAYPTVILQRQLNNLTPAARDCFEKSTFADEVYSFITNAPICNFTILKV